MFTLAIVFAGTMNAFGQYVKNLTGAPTCAGVAQPLTCATDDALHPLPGKVYTYSITTDPGTVESVHWFVTDESEIITSTVLGTPVLQPNRDVVNGTYVLTATSGVYDVSTNTAKTIDISWKTFDPLTHEVLLVAYVSGANGCSDNVEVYRIEPSFAFTLDVIALLDNGTPGAEECLSEVESAIYDGTNLNMDYGENWVFFLVSAANFVHSWEPTFSATAANGSAIDTIQWAYPTDAQANVNWNESGVPVDAQVAGGAVGADGECIVVRVKVDHAGEEHAEPENEVVTLTINGVMYDPAAVVGSEYSNTAYNDLDNPTAPVTACDPNVNDTATYTLTPRPALTDTTPVVAPGFEPKAP